MKRTLQAISMAGLLLPCFAGAVAEGDTTTVTVMGTIVDFPDCTVNSNNIIMVDFGSDLMTRKIDGVNYKKQLPFTLTCNNPATPYMRLKIQANRASFNNELVYTTKAGLGIQLYNGNLKYTPESYINFTYSAAAGGGVPLLYAVPVAQNNATLTSGAFSGSATMIFEYQ